MLSKEQKIKLILLFRKKVITKNQLQTIIELGFPAPILFDTENTTERQKKILSVIEIYRMLGQQITGITFKP